MSNLQAPFRELVDRRLWPAALVLLAGLAAVPLVLAKGEPAPVVPTAAAPAEGAVANAAATQPVVQVADASRTDRRRSVLGARKDPFAPAPGPKAPKAETATVTMPGGPPAAPQPSSPPAGPTAPPSPVGGVPFPTAPTTPKKVYELYSLIVRFGPTEGGALERSNLKRLKSLPSVEDPVVIYLGLMRDRRTAVFLVDAKATVVGDGRCLPSPSNCQTLHLKVGDTQFFDFTSADGQSVQYQLDVVKVARKRTADARAAKRSRYAVARGGREVLRARMSRTSGHRYDPRKGVVRAAGHSE